jgi:type 2 lantibiotic biosynthesis protein LanM
MRNFFGESCTQSISRRLRIMECVRVQQVEAIKLAMASTIPMDNGDEPALTQRRLSPKTEQISDDEVISIATDIGKNLLNKKYTVKEKPFWAGLVAVDDTSFTAIVLPPTLYDGAPGIGVFFAHLYQSTRIDAFKKAALEAHDFVQFQMRSPMQNPICGAFSGYGGLLYADMLLSRALNRPKGTNNGAIKRLKPLVDRDENFDIMTGAAGSLLTSLRWHAHTQNQDAIDVAATAARKLKISAEHQGTGIAWNTLKNSNTPRRLGGLSHGVTGIAWALSEWADFSNDAEARLLASQAFAYEQTLFDKNHGTWIDTRHNTPVYHWCHGAVGIALAADKMRTTLGNMTCDDVIHKAQKATRRYGLMNNHCLCHGNLGNSEIILTQGDRDQSRKILTSILADHKKLGYWRCGLPAKATTPGLMCGLAGIGYSLLRHIAPDKLPNILTLDI